MGGRGNKEEREGQREEGRASKKMRSRAVRVGALERKNEGWR